MKIKKAIIPAAGLGTRFLPATKAQPKEMLPIVDKPTIQYIVEEAVESGIEDIIIVTGKHKRAIEDHFDYNFELEDSLKKKNKNESIEIIRKIGNMANIYYVRQKEALGLGHAIYCAKSFNGNEPFAVLLGDDIIQSNPHTIKNMMDTYDIENTSIVAVQKVENKDVDKYGIIDPTFINKKITINDLVEKPKIGTQPSNYGIIGRYILEPQIFDALNGLKPGTNKEIQLTDALRISALITLSSVLAQSMSGFVAWCIFVYFADCTKTLTLEIEICTILNYSYLKQFLTIYLIEIKESPSFIMIYGTMICNTFNIIFYIIPCTKKHFVLTNSP
jgi:UTP--glucose-1-phosphate uridylyltransferase